MRQLKTYLGALAILVAAIFVLGRAGSSQTSQEQLWRHRNFGKALYETPTTTAQAPAELKKALDLAPDSARDRLNYGLALLRAGDLEKAIVELEKAQKQDPSLPHTWFNLGIAYKRAGRHEDATRQFERMIQLAPDEPVSHYNLGLLYKLANRPKEALQQFEIAAKLDDKLVAPLFQIYTYYRLEDDTANAQRALTAFQSAKERQQAAGDAEDMEWCAYAELYDPSQAHPAQRDNSAPAALKFEDRKLAGTANAATAGLLALDADGDGIPDMVVWSRDGVTLYRSGKDRVTDAGLGDLKDVLQVVAGDYDNDGLADLCVLTGSGARLFHNAKGRFAPSPVTLPAGRFEAAVWLDFDHDYDLDLLLFGEKSALLRNEGAAGFGDQTAQFPFAPGHALEAVVLRVMPDTKGLDLVVSYADHPGILYRDQLRGVFTAAPLAALPAKATNLRMVDFDNDSFPDLAFDASGSVFIAINRDGRFEARNLGATGPFAIADLENRGMSDVVTSGSAWRNAGLAQVVKYGAAIPQGVAWTPQDFDGDGREDLAEVAADGSIHVLLNRTETRNQWLRIALTGVKNLKMAPGTEVELKAGDHYQKKMFDGAPLLFGVGAHKIVDTARITWANGMIQNQPDLRLPQTLVAKEAPRLSGSCPMIFTWNGREFQFITDVLGVAPLGASSGDGNYFPVDHDEYIQIPGEALVERNGRYEIRIAEELNEVSYLDQVRLLAVDHPAGVEIFTNDKFKSPPFPEFRLFGVRHRSHPATARDDRGRDVLRRLLRRDRTYVDGFPHDFAGVAELHSLTLDFGAAAARDNKAVLLLNGWVDWADGSTFLGASQGSAGLVFPYLQVKDANGEWRTVVEDMGIPAGKPKTIAVDLTGKFLSSSREVRIVTNLCLYWDEIFLGEDSAAAPARLTPLDAESADLRLRGFSRPVIDPRREQPESFEYANATTVAPWNQTRGLYTRYGDVSGLVRQMDDRLVIMGSGDDLRLLFNSRALPPLPAGWRRDFLLLVDGWAKDADANTAFSQTVEPLPFHAMSAYPYPATEHYPDDAGHRAYRRQYNTRPSIRFIAPLVAGRSK